MQHKSYAYVYYKRALDLLPPGTSHYSNVKSKINALSSVLKDTELIDSHLQKAKEAEQNVSQTSLLDSEN